MMVAGLLPHLSVWLGPCRLGAASLGLVLGVLLALLAICCTTWMHTCFELSKSHARSVFYQITHISSQKVTGMTSICLSLWGPERALTIVRVLDCGNWACADLKSRRRW